MRRFLAVVLCVITVTGCIISQPLKVEAAYALPAKSSYDVIRAIYTLFETVLIATGVAEGVDNYQECDSLWEAFNKTIGIEPLTNTAGNTFYFDGCIQLEECQIQIYQGKVYVYGYEVKDAGDGIFIPDCYAVYDSYQEFLEYMGCPLALPGEEVWRNFTVLEGGKGSEPEPTPPPEPDNKTKIAFTGGTVGYMLGFLENMFDGKVEGINPDDYVSSDYGKKESVLQSDEVIEILEGQYGYDVTLADDWGFELPYYSYTGYQEVGVNGNTIVNGYCYVEFGVNNDSYNNTLRRYYIETYKPENVCLEWQWCQTRVVRGYTINDPHYELRLKCSSGTNNAKVYYQDYDLSTGSWSEPTLNYSTYDTTGKIISIGGNLTYGDPRFALAFDCPIFRYGESGASAINYFDSGIVNENDLMNGNLYDSDYMVSLLNNTIAPLVDKTINVNDLKNINDNAYQVFENTLPGSTDSKENTESLNDAISDSINDSVNDLGEVILPEPEFYPEINPEPEIVEPGVEPDIEPSPEPGPGEEPEISPAPSSAPEDLTEDFSKYKTDLTMLFPFCLPFDLIRLFEALDAEPKTPVFEIPFVVKELNIDMVISIDLTLLDGAAEIFRVCMLITFIFGLILVTGKVIKW